MKLENRQSAEAEQVDCYIASLGGRCCRMDLLSDFMWSEEGFYRRR